MTRYLIDNSVLQRLPRSSQIRAAVADILQANDELCSCAATLDEFAYSTRSPTEHAEAVARLRHSFLYLPLAPAIDQLIIDIRTALFAAGQGRAAGIIDVQIAATAVHHHASVLHYDSDTTTSATPTPTCPAAGSSHAAPATDHPGPATPIRASTTGQPGDDLATAVPDNTPNGCVHPPAISPPRSPNPAHEVAINFGSAASSGATPSGLTATGLEHAGRPTWTETTVRTAASQRLRAFGAFGARVG